MTALIVHSATPYNAETRLHRLRARFTTPQSDFYVRSHGPVPTLDAGSHTITIRGRIETPLDLSMRTLRDDFPIRSVMAVMQCAGNRRAELNRVRPVMGDLWAGGAIGNAVWTGVPLSEILRAAGACTDADLHVAFHACDTVGPDQCYGVSIPMTKALCPDVLLAFAMNGEPLTPEHGFPLRVVVPGFAGARSPKWLAGITVQDHPSDNPIQQTDYKLLPPGMTSEPVDWTKGLTINQMPLNAVICDPATGTRIKSGPTAVTGYATAGDRSVERVDVSADGGENWQQATIERQPDAPWSWTFWQTTLNLPRGEQELVVRAWDSAGQTQPAAAADTWNFKGYLCAAWHRVRVRAE